MPQLKYLHLGSTSVYYPRLEIAVDDFITFHGRGLQYLTMDVDLRLHLADLLPRCGNLRSLSVYLYQEDEIRILPRNISHPNLETINLQWAGFLLSPPVPIEMTMGTVMFRSRAQMLYLFPKLQIAKVTLDRSKPATISIQPGDRYVTCRNGSTTTEVALPWWFFDDGI